jgi:hypothetical protein
MEGETKQEIEITPAMIEAGRDILAEYFGDLGVSRQLEEAALTKLYRLAAPQESS